MKIKYYQTLRGGSPVEEFLLALPDSARLEIADAVILLASGQVLKMPLSRNLSSIRAGLHELRVRDKAGQVRVIYYIKKADAIYLVHAFRKKTQAIPRRDLDIITKRLKEI
jgi:phage-related protein